LLRGASSATLKLAVLISSVITSPYVPCEIRFFGSDR
jgi:hypothetical protein